MCQGLVVAQKILVQVPTSGGRVHLRVLGLSRFATAGSNKDELQ